MAGLCCSFALFYSAAVNAQTNTVRFDSPLPTPQTLEPKSVISEVDMALQFIAKRENIAPEQLRSLYQATVTFPTLGRSYLYVTADIVTGDETKVFNVLVDPKTMTVEPDYNAVRAAEPTVSIMG